MEALKLIGVVIVVIGFVLKFDTIATVVIAGLVTGLVAGMTPVEILETLGKSFINQRLATLFVLTLAVVGICERYGLKDKAVDLIRKVKNATAGKVISTYLAIRAVASAFSVRLGGHPQFVRPIVEPMASAAAVVRYGELTPNTVDKLKGHSAAAENYGNFFAQNCFMGASGTLLIVSTLVGQGVEVNALNIALMSIPIAVIAVIVGVLNNWRMDRSLDRAYGRSGAGKMEEGDAK